MSGPASERVQREWSARVAAEYTSAATTAHLVLWLIRIGASPDLIELCLDITRDELAHARLSHEVCVAAGVETQRAIPQEQLALPRASGANLLDDVVRGCVRCFCINETVAVPLFRAMREAATVEPACAALDQILVDEVRHRDFGWRLLEWLVQTHGDPIRDTAAAEARREIDRRESLGRSMASAAPLGPADATWGLIAGPAYGEIFARCRSRDIDPRFSRLDIAVPG